jgi:Protein of unknown function (DUF1761)
MQFAGINYIAIVVAAVAGWFLAGIWYGALAPILLKLAGGAGRGRATLLVTAIADLVLAWVLAGLMGHLGLADFTPLRGALTGAIVWFGFIMPTTIVNNRFAARPAALMLTDGGFWLANMLAMGAILGGIGVR